MGLVFVKAALQNARYCSLNSTPDFSVLDKRTDTTFFVLVAFSLFHWPLTHVRHNFF